MYDPVETDISKKVLLRILEILENRARIESGKFGLVGGWAVYLYVNENFMRATGKEYLKSRDIDVFVKCENAFLKRFKKIIFSMGFVTSGYYFRYQMIIDRNTLKPISEDESKRKPVFGLIYVFLDVFGDSKNEILPLWENDTVKKFVGEKAFNSREINGKAIILPKQEHLLAMKCESFLQRDNKEKRMKDACDIYALLFYSGMEKIPDCVKKISEKMLSEEVAEFIAQELFGDKYRAGLVKRNLLNILK